MATTLLTSCPVQALGEIAPYFHLSQLPWSLLQSNHFQTGMLWRFWNHPTQLLRIPANVDMDSSWDRPLLPLCWLLLILRMLMECKSSWRGCFSIAVCPSVHAGVVTLFQDCGTRSPLRGRNIFFTTAIHLPVALFILVTGLCGSMHLLPIHWNLNWSNYFCWLLRLHSVRFLLGDMDLPLHLYHHR